MLRSPTVMLRAPIMLRLPLCCACLTVMLRLSHRHAALAYRHAALAYRHAARSRSIQKTTAEQHKLGVAGFHD